MFDSCFQFQAKYYHDVLSRTMSDRGASQPRAVNSRTQSTAQTLLQQENILTFVSERMVVLFL